VISSSRWPRPSRGRLLHSALILTGAAVAARILGLVYRLVLARWLGAEGLGLFQLAFPLYITAVTWVAGGIPVAVAQLAAEGQDAPEAIWRAAARLTGITGVSAACALIVLAGPLARLLYHVPALAPLMRGLAPAVLVVGASSVLRGLFIGQQDMGPPALAQVAEPVARLLALLGLSAALSLAVEGRPVYAVGLVVVGEIAQWAVLRAAWHPSASRGPSRPRLTRRLLRLAAPVTLGRLAGSGIGLVEAALIPRWLVASGMPEATAIAWVGKLMGMALPVILFPTALSASLSTSLVPAVAEHLRRPAALRAQIATGIRTTALWSCPLTAVLVTVGAPLDDWLFHTHIGADLFVVLSGGAFFLYFDIVLSGVLRGLGRTELPLKNDLLASALEFAVLAATVLGAHQGPLGVAEAFAAGFFFSAVLNYRDVMRVTGIPIPWLEWIGPPAAAALPAVAAAWWGMHLAPAGVGSLVAAIGLALAAYAAGLWALRPLLSRP
jgi:O-antigen/teichoic acid export membrane protein